ncbi:MAG: hypothetical protein F6K58_26900 [Symploca sp. SIO2E9]|nr:hypothetical protein [Symploca sp. SIO2E9]
MSPKNYTGGLLASKPGIERLFHLSSRQETLEGGRRDVRHKRLGKPQATRTRRMPLPINESGKILLVIDPPRQRGQTA